MLRYKELKTICEGKQVGALYHYTDANGARSILNTDTIYASPLNEPESVSTTRDKFFHNRKGTCKRTFGKLARAGVKCDVSFELDGDKLSNNKKIKPYSYLKTVSKHIAGESEEQIHGDIENARSFIKKIRIHGFVTPHDMEHFKSTGIPVEHHPYKG